MGVHFIIVLPYRNLVIVHRVNTDKRGPYPSPYQIGRLLWLILYAAGETDIGENPSIEAAKGVRLTSRDLEKALAGSTVKGVRPNYLVEGGDTPFTLSCSPDGTIAISSRGEPVDTGRWWTEGDAFCFKFNQLLGGGKNSFFVVKDGATLKLYFLDGTRFAKLDYSKP